MTRPAALLLAPLLAVALVAAACGASGSSHPTPTPAPNITRPLDQIVLRVNDLPFGWATTPPYPRTYTVSNPPPGRQDGYQSGFELPACTQGGFRTQGWCTVIDTAIRFDSTATARVALQEAEDTLRKSGKVQFVAQPPRVGSDTFAYTVERTQQLQGATLKVFEYHLNFRVANVLFEVFATSPSVLGPPDQLAQWGDLIVKRTEGEGAARAAPAR